MKHSASLLIQDSSGAFLVIQRGGTSRHFRDMWEFPGGKIDAGETPHHALLREVFEEVGLAVNVPESDPACHIVVPSGEVEYVFFPWRCPNPRPEIRLSDEHQAFQWLHFTEVRKLKLMEPHREFLERYWHQQQVEAYKLELPHYQTYAHTLQSVLNKLKIRCSPLAIVQARAKPLSSFSEKCLRKADKYDDPAHQLTDLCGGRIVTTTTHEMDMVCRQIRRLFAIDEDDDTRSRHEVCAFGYLSVHFIVHFPEGSSELLDVPVPPELAGRKAEIQVRTLLQHAHSEVTHDRLYKSGFLPPEHCRREAARVAALLEEADEEFARFVAKLDAYVGNYAAHLPREKRKRQIADLRLVLQHEEDAAKKPALALRIARLARAAWDWSGVVEALSPFEKTQGPDRAVIQMELGNALCRHHRDLPQGTDYRRGLQLLENVGQPKKDLDSFMESDERSCRATALAWLGSALAKVTGQRNEARDCLAGAVHIMPDDPYHFTSFVELDIVVTGTDDHLDLLAPSLRQAASRCESHVHAGIEVTRAWLTLSKIRLLLGDNGSALDALCVGTRCTESQHPVVDFQRSLDRLKDAIGRRKPGVALLGQCVQMLAKVKALQSGVNPAEFDWQPFAKLFDFKPQSRYLILAGSTSSKDEPHWADYEKHLRAALNGFEGYVLTGGTSNGICGIAARVASDFNATGKTKIELIGYVPEHLPHGVVIDPGFANLVRSVGTSDFTIAEPLQMWSDLLLSGVDAGQVRMLCLGGGELSASELALAWALGARVFALADSGPAATRFGHLLQCAEGVSHNGMLLPEDPASLAAFLTFDAPIDGAKWEKAGQMVHEAYLNSQHKNASQSNLLPWSHLSEDFKHSNRHQAACAVDILRRCGFQVESTDVPADKIPLPEFSKEEVEEMAEHEHGRWIVERLNKGWRYGAKKDAALQISPYLISWKVLPEKIKNYDRDAVRTWPSILAGAGLKITRK